MVITNRDTSILEVAKLMRHHHVGGIIVVESKQRHVPVGIITFDDMIDVIAEQLSTLTLIFGREHRVEVERRS